MSLFVNKGKKTPADLASVIFEVVVEPDTKKVIGDAYSKLKPKDNTITVTPSSTGDEKTVFDDLQKTPFGKSVGYLNSDFGAGKVTKYVITDGATRPTLTVSVK